MQDLPGLCDKLQNGNFLLMRLLFWNCVFNRKAMASGLFRLAMSSTNHRPQDTANALLRTLLGSKLAFYLLASTAVTFSLSALAQDSTDDLAATEAEQTAKLSIATESIQPLLGKFCLRCHNAEEMKSNIRLDQLDNGFPEDQLFLWEEVLRQVESATMPPEDELQPSGQQRNQLVASIRDGLQQATARDRENHGSFRRLTVSQYRNTLRDLLALEEDLTGILPPDGLSREGFTNDASVLALSPLQIEYYFEIAEKALDLCLVDSQTRPVIQNFRVDLGKNINATPYPKPLILGANSELLDNADFIVTQLAPVKPFDYQPLEMQTAFRFIEGYEGNSTVRGWQEFNSIYHAVFACMRGARGYPKGDPYQVVPSGLLLRPAIPSSELFGQSSTYGPRANFKISLRELPDHGNVRIKVRAAKYPDGLLLDATDALVSDPANSSDILDVSVAEASAQYAGALNIAQSGVYQIDVNYTVNDQVGDREKRNKRNPENDPQFRLALQLGDREFAAELDASALTQVAHVPSSDDAISQHRSAFLLVRLPAGNLQLECRAGKAIQLVRLELCPMAAHSQQMARFVEFEQQSPILGVHLGLRRDCGSTFKRVESPQPVPNSDVREFIFEASIADFPSPHVDPSNENYLAGFREIAVRSEYTDGRDMPRLQICSVEFEGPYLQSWPPATHQRIFVDSEHPAEGPAHAKAILSSFMARAFRRPITEDELSVVFGVWQQSFGESKDFRDSIIDALLVVLTSPQFLFLSEVSHSPAAEALDAYELASKLSYFLWNTAPDEPLLLLAAQGKLKASLDSELSRMLHSERFDSFVREFSSQWLSLDKFDVVEVDNEKYPQLTRELKSQLREEPIAFLSYALEHNLPLSTLVNSDFLVVNEAVAGYYGLSEKLNCGFEFIAVPHRSKHLGGLLTQASILAGLSNGRESNPVKRGAWLARKIIAEPPDDPPPNVPELPGEEQSSLTLREKLERHRNQEGCAKCHSGIDPWGVPFEQFDAGGAYKGAHIDASSTLPDGTQIGQLNDLKDYLVLQRQDQVAFSFLKHLTCYAIGRSLSYHEQAELREQVQELGKQGYHLQDLLRFVVHSEIFLKK